MTTHNRKIAVLLSKEGVIDYFYIRYNAVHRGAEQDIFAHLGKKKSPGLVSLTATCWGKMLKEKKLPAGEQVPTAGDCCRFVLANSMVHTCMMGVRNMTMLEENLRGIAEGPFDTEQLDAMCRIGDHLYGKSRCWRLLRAVKKYTSIDNSCCLGIFNQSDFTVKLFNQKICYIDRWETVF